MLTENVYYSERPDKVYIYPYDGQRMCRADFPTDIEVIETEEGEQYLCNVYSLRTNYEESLLEDMESNYEKWLDRAKEYVELRKRTMLKSVNRSATPNDLDSFTRFFALGRTVYGGTLDVVSGELTIDRVFETVDGARITRVSKDGDVWRVTPNPNLTPSGRGYTDGISNIYPWSTSWGGISGMTIGVAVNNSQGGEFLIRDDSLTSLTDFRTRFNETPIQLCYELATPQTYQLDPQTISLLHGNNNVWSDGEVEMVYSVELPTDGEVSYPLEGEYEITYSATDKCGNIGEAIRHITVQ